AVGDQLLVEAAHRLEMSVRGSDSVSRGDSTTIARMGGDEFMILLDGMRHPQDSRAVARRIVRELARPCSIEGQEVAAAASVGIAMGSPSYNSPDESLRDADSAMYSAKSMRQGRYLVFDAT